jgi:hypothetical protein
MDNKLRLAGAAQGLPNERGVDSDSKELANVQIPQEKNHRRLKHDFSRAGSVNGLLISGAIFTGLIASCVFICFDEDHSASGASQESGNHTIAIPAESPEMPLFPVTIRKPLGPPQCLTGLTDASGEPVSVSCSTCHAARKPNFENKVVGDLNEFHGSLAFAHGTVSCLSCHNAEDYDALKLADGSRIEFTDVMTLCAQCHGPQTRDYEHGAHGGMNGYWDLTRGPRTRNNCIDCHNPHSPQFPKMQPTFKPRDRFLEKVDAGDGH